MSYCRVVGAAGVVLVLFVAGTADAAVITGCVLLDEECDGRYDPDDPPGYPVPVQVQLKDSEGDVVATTMSEAGGIGVYEFPGIEPGNYQICITVPGDASLGSTTCAERVDHATCNGGDNPILVSVLLDAQPELVVIKANFLLCRLCWMTGGGVKFEPAAEGFLAVVQPRGKKSNHNGGGPSDSVGGNVFPSCSPLPGNGGNWNHPAHSLGLHLLGRDIEVVRCGNVDGIEPGTESPVCSVNFIEFEGTGVVKGLGNNHIDDIDVCFFGRVEDHNEPGNSNANEDILEVDRYFLRVFDCDTGNLVMGFLVDDNGQDNPGEVDPLAITGGNFQIHCTSCDGRPNGNGGGGSLPEEFREGLRLGTYFLRGDLNVDGAVNVADAIYGLNYLFSDLETQPRCMDAADANDDGSFDISDPVALLTGLFANGPLLAPFPVAGIDETRDRLDCGLLLAQVERPER